MDSNLETALCGSWSDCCPDQLQTFAVELFALLTRATHLIDVRTVALETFAHDASAAAQVHRMVLYTGASQSSHLHDLVRSLQRTSKAFDFW